MFRTIRPRSIDSLVTLIGIFEVFCGRLGRCGRDRRWLWFEPRVIFDFRLASNPKKLNRMRCKPEIESMEQTEVTLKLRFRTMIGARDAESPRRELQ